MIALIISQILEGILKFAGELLFFIVTGIVWYIRQINQHMSDVDARLDNISDELRLMSEETRLDEHEERMDQLQQTQEEAMRYITGDENDPSSQGILAEIDDVHDEVDEVKQLVEDMHTDVHRLIGEETADDIQIADD